MNPDEHGVKSLHFSTRALPKAKRSGALRDLFDRSICMEIEAEPGQSVEMAMLMAPGLRRAQMLSALTARVTRPAPRLADGEDTVCLMIKTGGHLALTQGRHQGIPNDGDGVLLVYREPVHLQFVDATYLSIRVPFTALSPMAQVSPAAAHCIPRHTEALTLLRTYVTSLPERFDDPGLSRLVATHVYDLMALAIGATAEGRQLASQRGVRAARLHAIEADLTVDSTQSIDHIAARHGISVRYVQLLFEEQGTTFSEFALSRRLDAAHGMLTSPRFSGWTIGAIAYEAGFGDLSYFNRRFRRRYGMTPRDLRGQLARLTRDGPGQAGSPE